MVTISHPSMSVALPSDYLSYLDTGSDVGTTDGLPGYFQLWAPSELAELNRSYQVMDYATGFIGFGSDGGGEMLAFDSTGAVFMIPFVGMAAATATRIAASWSEVVSRIVE